MIVKTGGRVAAVSPLPLMPRTLTEAGLCARHPDPELWTSSLSADRQRAAAVCGGCQVLEACREWSANLSAGDNSIYGAMGARERRLARTTAA